MLFVIPVTGRKKTVQTQLQNEKSIWKVSTKSTPDSSVNPQRSFGTECSADGHYVQPKPSCTQPDASQLSQQAAKCPYSTTCTALEILVLCPTWELCLQFLLYRTKRADTAIYSVLFGLWTPIKGSLLTYSYSFSQINGFRMAFLNGTTKDQTDLLKSFAVIALKHSRQDTDGTSKHHHHLYAEVYCWVFSTRSRP